MATEGVITFKGNIVQWNVKDALGTSGSTGDFAWYSSVSGTATAGWPTTTNVQNQSNPATESWWMVSKIQFIPSTAQTSDSYAQLQNGGEDGPILVRHNFGAVREMDNVEWNFDPPLKCRPYLGSSTKMGNYATNAFWVFHLA